LFIVRDPRSTLVSYFHYYQTLAADARLSLDEFIAAYLTDGLHRFLRTGGRALGSPGHRMDRPLGRASRDDHQVEDLHRDRRGVLAKIAAFCAIPYTDDAMLSALERGAFEAM
jgi:hypothetical protein